MDTGSSVCTICEGMVGKVFLNVSNDSQSLFSYGNAEEPTLYRIGKKTLKVTVDMASEDGVEFVVVRHKVQIRDIVAYVKGDRDSTTKRGYKV